jgi:hypothetical protein
MDWNNVDLTSGHERDQNILDGYSFDTLLLEVHCNLKVIDEQTVRMQFETSLNSNIESAWEIFNNNLKNITLQAKKERNQ